MRYTDAIIAAVKLSKNGNIAYMNFIPQEDYTAGNCYEVSNQPGEIVKQYFNGEEIIEWAK